MNIPTELEEKVAADATKIRGEIAADAEKAIGSVRTVESDAVALWHKAAPYLAAAAILLAVCVVMLVRHRH